MIFSAAVGVAALALSAIAPLAQSNPLFQNQLWWFGAPNPVPPTSVWIYEFAPIPMPPAIGNVFAQIPQSCTLGSDCSAFVQGALRGAGPALAPVGIPAGFMATLAEAAVAGATIGLATSNNLDNFSQALADVVGAAATGTSEGLADAGVPAAEATVIAVQAVASSARSAMVSVAAEPNLPVELKAQVVSQMVEKAVEVMATVAPNAPASAINAAVGEIATAVVEAASSAGISVAAAPEIVTALQSLAALSTDPAQQTAIVQVATDLAAGTPIAEVLANLPTDLPAASPS